MQQSEHIDQLATALAKAQSEITGAKKGSDNPFFNSKYADLAAVWDVAREPLSKNGLALVQFPSVVDGRVRVTTLLMHASGQYVAETLDLRPAKDDPQAVGSAITYARRYALAAAVGVAQEDDDGNAATHTANNASITKPALKREVKPKPEEKPPEQNLKGECKALADKLGVPAAARKALIEQYNSDWNLVRAALVEMNEAWKFRDVQTKQEELPV